MLLYERFTVWLSHIVPYLIAFLGGYVIAIALQKNSGAISSTTSISCDDKLLQGPLSESHPITLSTLKKGYLNPPSSQPYNLNNPKHVLNSKPNEIFLKYLFILFENEPPGFFIEAGAFDGETSSNTIWLEYVKKWTGLLIEARDSNYKTLLNKHRKAWTSNTCISTGNYPKVTTLENPTKRKNETSIYEEIVFYANSRVLDSFFHFYRDEISKKSYFTYNELQCFPLASYLYALNVSTVDFVSLDTQGGEKDMILKFPHDKINLRSIVVEHFNTIDEQPSVFDKHFIRKMKELGYKLTDIQGYDYFFIKQNDPLASRLTEKIL